MKCIFNWELLFISNFLLQSRFISFLLIIISLME